MGRNTFKNIQEGGEKNMRFFGLVLLALVLLSASAVAVTQQVDVPASDTRYSGTIDVAVNVNTSLYNCRNTTGSVGCSNITKVIVNYTRTSPSGSETTGCSNESYLLNGSVDVRQCSFNTNVLEDVGVYTFTAYIWNATTQRNTTTSTGVLVGNTVPSAVFGASTPADNVEQRGSTVTINTEANINASKCTLFVGAKDYSVDPSSDVCSKQLSGLSDGSYTIYWRNTDGQDTTTGASRTLKVNARGISGAAATKVTQEATAREQGDTTMVVIIGSVIVLLVVVGGAFGVWKLARNR